MHIPLIAVAYSHSCAFFAGLVLRAWGFGYHTCGDTGVTYWVKGGREPGGGGGGGGREGAGKGEGEGGEGEVEGGEVECGVCGLGVGDSGGGGGGGGAAAGGSRGDTRRCFAGCPPPPRPPPPAPPLNTDNHTWAPWTEQSAPVVILHGLGIGIPPYLHTMAHLLRATPDRPIALVCLPQVSLHACTKVPTPDELVDAVEGLCRRHHLRRPCLLGHSFGSFLIARACQRSRVGAAVLVDPVAICLMLPTVISKALYQLEDKWRELVGWEPAGSARVPREVKRAAAAANGAAAAEAAAAAAEAAEVEAEAAEVEAEAAAAGAAGHGRMCSYIDGSTHTHRSNSCSNGSGGSSGGGSGGGGGGGGDRRGILLLLFEFLFTLARDWFVIRELSCNVALCRQFWWYKVCLWAEDMPDKSLVILQSADDILDPGAIARHVLNRGGAAADVLWLEGFAHGEVLAPQGFHARQRLVAFVQGLDGPGPAGGARVEHSMGEQSPASRSLAEPELLSAVEVTYEHTLESKLNS